MNFEVLASVHVYKSKDYFFHWTPRALDADGNGYVDFLEFILVNNLVCARTPKEKLSWAFKVWVKLYLKDLKVKWLLNALHRFDADHSGEIDHEETIGIIECILDGKVLPSLHWPYMIYTFMGLSANKIIVFRFLTGNHEIRNIYNLFSLHYAAIHWN